MADTEDLGARRRELRAVRNRLKSALDNERVKLRRMIKAGEAGFDFLDQCAAADQAKRDYDSASQALRLLRPKYERKSTR